MLSDCMTMPYSQLFMATVRGSEDEVRRLLALRHQPDRQEVNGATVLHAAAELGYTGLAELFIGAQADVDALELNGCTPLYVASLNGRVGVVRALVNAQADVDLPKEAGTAPISVAAEDGRIDVIVTLIRAGANVNARRQSGSTPLFMAAQNGHHRVVSELIESGADVNMQQRKGWSPLHIACQAGHSRVVELLVAAPSDVNIQDVNGCTPLYIASQQGRTKIIERLIHADADVNLQRCTGESALYAASQNGHDVTLKALLKARADVNLATSSGETPLYAAARLGLIKVVEILIEAGAGINQTQFEGCSPLLIAAEFGHHLVAQVLIKAGASLDLVTIALGSSPLTMAAQKGHYKVVQALINVGANVDHRSRLGTTPLYMAAQNGHLRVVQALLAAGADPDAQDIDGLTPLVAGAQEGHYLIVSALLHAQASPDLQRSTGESPLWMACQEGHSRVVEALIKAQANLDLPQRLGFIPTYVAAQNGRNGVVELLMMADANADTGLPDDGATALYIASQQGHYSVVETLTQSNRINPNVQLADGCTPLFAASQDGHLRVVETLIAAGADANLQRVSGESPLMIAAQNKHASVVQALLKAPADPDLQNRIGSAPLYMSARMGSLEVAQLLLRAQANVNLRAITGQTPLHAAVEANRFDILDLLLRFKADVSARTAGGETPLGVALRMGHSEISKRLMGLQREQVGFGALLLRACCFGNAKEARRLMELCVVADGEASAEEAFSALPAQCRNSLREGLHHVVEGGQLLEGRQQNNNDVSDGHLSEFETSEQLHAAFLRAGFSHRRANLQACLSDVLQDIVRRRRKKEDIFVVGSYSEGWGNSLAQLSGRTAPDSDIDVTEFYPGPAFHILGRCCCVGSDTSQTVPYVNGHVKWRGYTSSAARPKFGSTLRPAVDIVPAFTCCSYPPKLHLPQTLPVNALPRGHRVLQDLRQEVGPDRCGCHLVTAAPPGEEGRQLRVSTTFLERQFMRDLGDLQGQLFVLLKYVIKRILSDLVQGLKTYHGKTLLFHMVESTPEEDWTPGNLVELTRRALRRLVSSLQSDAAASNECMRHYFLPDATLYIKNGSGKLEIVAAIAQTVDRLPAILSDFMSSLKPLDVRSRNLYFHPFLVLPHLTHSAQRSQTPKADYHEIYDIVYDMLVKLSDSKRRSLTELLSILERIPDCAATARECLRIVALLKHQMISRAATVAQDCLQLAVSRGVPCLPNSLSKDFVWQHLLSTDSAWKFCFDFDRCPSFAYLPEFVQTIFMVELPNYCSYFYVNFDVLMKSLCIELTGADRSAGVVAEWFSEIVQGDNPEPQELLLTLNYCPDLSTLAKMLLTHGSQLEANAVLSEFLVRLQQDWPELRAACVLATLGSIQVGSESPELRMTQN